jgi:type IV secretion system protein VirB5
MTSQNSFNPEGIYGRKEWYERYQLLHKNIRHWRTAFFVSIGFSAMLTAGMVYLSCQQKVKPFVIQSNQTMPYYLQTVEEISQNDQRLINFALNQFIINARTVVRDHEAQKNLVNKVYAYAADRTLPYLTDFYQKNNPLEQSTEITVSVSILNALPLSKDTWQIVWEENKRHAENGTLISTHRWMANVTYAFGEVQEKFLHDNPFGLYITDLTWSENHTSI